MSADTRQIDRLSFEGSDSGISVVELPSRGRSIPPARETVTAFIGPTPRGPRGEAVPARSLEDFLLRFGVAGQHSRMEFMLRQYFDNGGTLAVIVRACGSDRRSRLSLPGPGGELLLDARHPGPLECLRAAVDYDNIDAADDSRFNLVIHRCRSAEEPLVEAQEVYQGLSLDPDSGDHLAGRLAASTLVQLAAPPPLGRPFATGSRQSAADYIYGSSLTPDSGIPTDYDLIGSPLDGSGLFALDSLAWIDFICLLPGVGGAGLGPVARFAAERYCRERRALLLLDPPPVWRSMEDVIAEQRQRRFSSSNALVYFPGLRDPQQATADLRSAAGAIAGRLCAIGLLPDTPLTLSLGRMRPAVKLDELDLRQLAQLGVNGVRRGGPGGAQGQLADMVTLARSGGAILSWNKLSRRRLVLFILDSVLRYTRWAAFEPPGPALWDELRAQVAAFLALLESAGLLVASGNHAAFYVKCDADTQPVDVMQSGQLTLLLGLALGHPGGFVAYRVEHGDDGSRVSELGWQPGLA